MNRIIFTAKDNLKSITIKHIMHHRLFFASLSVNQRKFLIEKTRRQQRWYKRKFNKKKLGDLK